MNLKSITLIALSLALAGCGNKGSLVQAAPRPVESIPADAETTAPAETVPVVVVPAETVPAEVPAVETETPPADAPEETPPAAEEPAPDDQDG